MNRTAKTLITIFGIVAAVSIISVIVYYIGSIIGKSIVSGVVGGNIQKWRLDYLNLIKIMGTISGAALMAWYICSRFIFRVTVTADAGKRAVWGIIMSVLIVLCFIVPYIYAATSHGKFIMNIVLSLVFVVYYGLIYYWGGSIITTADAFKYTPVGAMMIRKPKNRK